jgi:hypothetical protein
MWELTYGYKAGIVTPMQRQDWRQDLAQKVRLNCFIAGIGTFGQFFVGWEKTQEGEGVTYQPRWSVDIAVVKKLCGGRSGSALACKAS